MENLKEIQASLPLTFQKTEMQKNTANKRTTKIGVQYIHTDSMTPYNFYRPISKIISL